MLTNNHATIRIHTEQLGQPSQIADYLICLQSTYESIYAFHLIVSTAQNQHAEQARARYGAASSLRTLRRIREPKLIVLPEDHIYLRSVVIHSPGFWEAVGALSPLECIRKYLNDRHERRKDRDYREKAETAKLNLENEKLRTEIAKEQIAVLKSLGVPEDKIREALTRYVLDPLKKLEYFQDVNLIQYVELVDNQTKTQAHPEE